jgi:tRNA-dihydrouridine synthase 3
MTMGGNLPYRRLCAELGARVLMSEMTVARRLKQKRRGEFALIRKAPDEPFFGVQLAGTDPGELGWAAALVESRGADLVDVNVGCPIDHFTRKGMGAALGRQPKRIRRIVEAMKLAVASVPVTAKIRLGWNEADRNFLEQARAAADGGADAIIVHGRTRDARYRQSADWDAIGEVAAAVQVPVVGNGDILFPHHIGEARARSGCAGLMAGRGALIKPWLFREAVEGYWDITPEERLAIYRRYVELAREHWGEDEHGLSRVREFLAWHLGFWCRYAPRRADGSWPGMQTRESAAFARSPLEALLARGDQSAIAWLADRLAARDALEPAEAPPPSNAPGRPPGDRDETAEG